MVGSKAGKSVKPAPSCAECYRRKQKVSPATPAPESYLTARSVQSTVAVQSLPGEEDPTFVYVPEEGNVKEGYVISGAIKVHSHAFGAQSKTYRLL